jgi:hypothetical protein
MSVRLFEEFQKQNQAFTHRRKSVTKDQSAFKITIPLKNSSKMKFGGDNGIKLDDDFIRVIEYEYAVRFLEHQNTQATPQAIQRLLKKYPLSSCELVSGWNNSGALADVLHIYPFKADKRTFDDNKEELGFSSKIKVAKQKKTAADYERERVERLKEEERQIKEMVGLKEENLDFEKLTGRLL